MIFYANDRATLHLGSALDKLWGMPDNSVHCCVTSPPYHALRAYGTEPQVWLTPGSDPGCAHEWGEEVLTAANRGGDKPCGKGEGGADNRTYHPHRPVSSAFCQRCGAWRGELGLEPDFSLFLTHLVAIFEEVKRVLHPSGTCWVNMGDSYACKPNGRSAAATKVAGNDDRTFRDKPDVLPAKGPRLEGRAQPGGIKGQRTIGGAIKEKDLVGQPWALAFALRDAGWWLRDAIVWHKPGPMPSSVTDRFTNAYEMVFLLTKSSRYYFDQFAVRERATKDQVYPSWEQRKAKGAAMRRGDPGQSGDVCNYAGVGGDGQWRNRRNVWTVNTAASGEEHFAAFPPALVKPCVMAGTSEKGCCSECGAPWKRLVRKSGGTTGKGWHDHNGDDEQGQRCGAEFGNRVGDTPGYRVEHIGWAPTCKHEAPVVPCRVLDPFAGTGTTGVVALEFGRHFVGIELSPKYCKIARKRLQGARQVLSFGDDDMLAPQSLSERRTEAQELRQMSLMEDTA